MKTVFITITRGLLMRNIMRSRVFGLLKQNKDLKIVVLILNIYNIPPPQYLAEELRAENVIVELVPNRAIGGIQKAFNTLTDFLVFTESSKYYITERPEAHKRMSDSLYFFINLFYRPLARFGFLKKAVRAIELLIYKNKNVAYYFDKYKPDLVFSTAIQSGMDYDILKEARKRKVKTISMPKSWDNIDRVLFRVLPDIFLVQHKGMKEQAVKYQALDPETIKVVGFPQFDIYKENIFVSKEEYCAKRGLDAALPIVFLGSEGLWSEGDDKIFGEIISYREAGVIKNCNIVIRPHFSTAQKNYYDRFKQYKNIYIDNNFRKSGFFGDKWDPTRDDQIDLANLLYHSSATITFASTLTLDAACFNKPVIALCFGVTFKDGIDVTKKMYESGHYREILETQAAILVRSKEELAEAINKSIENPHLKQREVATIRENMCGTSDGKSGERIVDAIIDVLYK